MKIAMTQRIRLSLIVMMFWAGIGCYLYPRWWYKYIFVGGIFDINYLIEGVRDFIDITRSSMFYITVRNPMLLITILGTLVLIKFVIKREIIKLPNLSDINNKHL